MDARSQYVVVLPYDPTWPELFRQEASRLRGLLPDEIVSIHHIGSTSVPGLSAKPIVDVLVEVRDIQRIDGYNPRMISAGYQPEGENGLPGRRFFVRGNDSNRTYHIHMYQTGHPDIPRHLHFRDYLIAHPEDRQAYEALKIDLAQRYPHDRPAYQAGKETLIKAIEAKAEAWSSLAPAVE